MTDIRVGVTRPNNPPRGTFSFTRASKASICAFTLAMTPIGIGLAQTGGDGDIAPTASDTREDNSQPGSDAPAPAAPAPAAPAAAAPAVAAPASTGTVSSREASIRELDQVTVTGSAVPRADAETALPVSVYNADDLRNQGVTSTADILDQVVSNDTSAGPGSGYGLSINGGASYANLRGLGTGTTLTLLNGRRLANNSFNGGASDLASIPFSAIERVEVLKSGASAIYGTDAIAGVINYITKKDYQGGDIRLQYETPTRSGGGPTRVLDGTFGFGDLAEDRFNVMGSFTYRTQDGLTASSRPDITDAYQPDRGLDTTSILPYPANFYQGTVTGNPQFADGCPGPYTIPSESASNCLYNNNDFYQIQQNDNYVSFFGKGQYLITDNHKLSASFLFTHDEVDSQIGPYGTIGVMQPGTPFYPTDTVNAVGGDPSQPLDVYYRNTISGPRTTHNLNQSMRAIIELKGRFGKTHYNTALNWGRQTTSLTYTGGYLNALALDDPAFGPTPDDDRGDDLFSSAINSGLVNPFSSSYSDAANEFFRSLRVTGQAEKDRIHQYAWDGKLNRDLGDWFGAGPIGLAIGSEVRYKRLEVTSNDTVQNQIAGGGLSGQALDEDRTIESVYGDANIPLPYGFEVEAAGRYDHYSDFGSTANPKVSLRYQPVDQIVFRGSYGTGFQAPNLYDLYTQPSFTYTQSGLNDPELCPNGTAVGGFQQRNVCDTQFERRYGGNRDLNPKTSEQYGFGFVLQPLRNLSASIDYYNIQTDGEASLLPVNLVFENLDQYSGNIVRNPEGDPAAGRIDYIQTDYANLGQTRTEGLDTELNFSLPTAKYGQFLLQFKGTYVLNYDYQTAPDQEFVSNEGEFVVASPIIQWKHRILLGWHKAGFNVEFINHFTEGYTDYDPSTHKDVSDYITYDLSAGYRFDNGVHIQLGSDNIFDQDPPFTNQNTTGIGGYDPRYASAIGRTVFATLGYKF